MSVSISISDDEQDIFWLLVNGHQNRNKQCETDWLQITKQMQMSLKVF